MPFELCQLLNFETGVIIITEVYTNDIIITQ